MCVTAAIWGLGSQSCMSVALSTCGLVTSPSSNKAKIQYKSTRGENMQYKPSFLFTWHFVLLLWRKPILWGYVRLQRRSGSTSKICEIIIHKFHCFYCSTSVTDSLTLHQYFIDLWSLCDQSELLMLLKVNIFLFLVFEVSTCLTSIVSTRTWSTCLLAGSQT